MMNYGAIKEYDIANGPGVRISLFVSGCRHHCDGCFNSTTWDFNYGSPFTSIQSEYICTLMKKPYVNGLTILGGEPFEPENQSDVAELIRQVRKTVPKKSIWVYTGYTYEKDLLNKSEKWPKVCNWNTPEILNNIDVLVDGEFIKGLYDPSLQFKGSSNQRIIDVKKSLLEGRTVLWKDKDLFMSHALR